jgi:hypothetical protein
MTAADDEQKASGNTIAVVVRYASQDIWPVRGSVQYRGAL